MVPENDFRSRDPGYSLILLLPEVKVFEETTENLISFGP